jgi:hypothetical protein
MIMLFGQHGARTNGFPAGIGDLRHDQVGGDQQVLPSQQGGGLVGTLGHRSPRLSRTSSSASRRGLFGVRARTAANSAARSARGRPAARVSTSRSSASKDTPCIVARSRSAASTVSSTLRIRTWPMRAHSNLISSALSCRHLNAPVNPRLAASVPQRLHDLLGHLLGIAEQHHRVRPEEQHVVHPGIA